MFKLAGFPDPLVSFRYPNIKYIDVRIFSESKMNKARGLTFDESSSAQDYGDKKARSLVIYILRDIDPKKKRNPGP